MIVRDKRLQQYHESLDLSRYRPLKVIFSTLTPIMLTEQLHLDGILSFAVVQEATQGLGLPQTSDSYFLPVPLELEANFDGLPLWKSTDFYSIGEERSNVTNYHQRTAENPYLLPAMMSDPKKRRQPPQTEGRYIDYRIPINTRVAKQWEATCVGDLAEIYRLLSTYVDAVGQKTAHGYGNVVEWIVEPIKTFSYFDDSGRLLRPLPCQTAEDLLKNAVNSGWSPPYWQKNNWRFCNVA